VEKTIPRATGKIPVEVKLLAKSAAYLDVDFFDQNWNWIGSKANLHNSIRDRTGILDLSNYKTASVAQKMSWASFRETTRIEDQAYCLLGLFGVHMPPLYGEGENAFIRLQLEILSKTDDDSIFVFTHDARHSGMLALSPWQFRGSSSIVKAVWDPLRPSHSMSSKGLEMHLRLISDSDYSLAPLNCAIRSEDGKYDRTKVIALQMYRVPGDPTWRRYRSFEIVDVDTMAMEDGYRTMLYAEIVEPFGYMHSEVHDLQIVVLVKSLYDIGLFPKWYGVSAWEGEEVLIDIDLVPKGFGEGNLPGFWTTDTGKVSGMLTFTYFRYDDFHEGNSCALLIFENKDLQRIALVLGRSECRLWMDILVLDTDESMEQIMASAPSARNLLIGRDRISCPFLEGALNGRVKGLSNPVVEIIFDPDGKLRWPVRDTVMLDN
jgi:hypothetical protein